MGDDRMEDTPYRHAWWRSACRNTAAWLCVLLAASAAYLNARVWKTSPVAFSASVGGSDDMPLEAQSFATRILLDAKTGTLAVTRECVFVKGLQRTRVMHGDLICDFVPDECRVEEIGMFEATYSLAGLEVRVLLYQHGPPEPHDGPFTKSATEITLWVDGMTRAVGLLENSFPEEYGTPVFRSLVVHGDAAQLSTDVVRFSENRADAAMIFVHLDPTRARTAKPSDCFEEAEEVAGSAFHPTPRQSCLRVLWSTAPSKSLRGSREAEASHGSADLPRPGAGVDVPDDRGDLPQTRSG
jgi:hypothetical protein